VDAAELEPRVVDGFAGDTDAAAAADADVAANADAFPHDEEGSYDEAQPYDEDGPYGEVAGPATLIFDTPATEQSAHANAAPVPDASWRDLPAPNPQEIAWPTPADESVEISAASRDDDIDTSDDESQTTDEDDAHNVNVAALHSAKRGVAPEVGPEVQQEIQQEIQQEGESMHESDALIEPEPLVEPSPLPRSPFEPDLSKVGRPEAVAPVQERFPVRPVRPLGDEPVFTTADRLRASGFAPVASERVSDQPAPPRESDDSASDVASISGTAPRISEVFGTQPHDAVTGRNGVPDSNVGPDVDGIRASDHATLQVASAGAASPEAVCAQCGGSLSESDIFCGSCGFVKLGVGPTSRSNSAPALDPFPWGTPTVRASTVTETAEPEPESNRQQAQEASDEPTGVTVLPDEVAHAEEPAEPEESAQAHNAELESHSAPVPLDEELSRGENVTRDDHEAGVRIQSADHDPVMKVDSAEASFEPLSAVPHHCDGEGQSDAEDVQSSATIDEAAAAPGNSVLAPPPMSHHRVELPIAPPTPLASVTSDEEDVEDTRIVERSISGTRFVLQFSTGDSVIVTGTGLVGRNPIPEPSEKFDIVVPITDPSKSVSKTHLEFGQMAGAFWISDRYSGNGSVVREPGGEPKRCEPGKRYRVMRGTRVEIGEQFFIVS
jgi:hypothetical protein